MFFFSEIPGPTSAFRPPYDEEDYSDQYGSAEEDDVEEEMSNALPGRNSWSFSSEIPGGPVRGTFHSSSEDQAQVPARKGGNRNLIGGSSASPLRDVRHLFFLPSLLFIVILFQ